jgi:EAL domain-containing protein (putative c-di-GMP-specific phosphodiesterase class I)
VPAPAVPVRDRALESAISREQIEVHYQPIIEPRSGRIVGAEALARASLEPSADLLFARAAKARLDERLSRLVQRIALRRAAVWDGPLSEVAIAINLLPADLCCEGFDNWFIEEMDNAGIDPKRVIVEITESALLVEPEAAAARLLRLLRETTTTSASPCRRGVWVRIETPACGARGAPTREQLSRTTFNPWDT